MPKVYIDGTEYDARPGANMLEVALENGLDLPYFCWHPAMGSVGSCRLCAVKAFKDENDSKGKIQMACMTPAAEGTRISMRDPEAVEFRRYVIEWLMVNHPHDCPVCDEGGECHLQDMTAMCAHVYRRFRGRKRTYNNQYLGPFVNHEMNRCIQCYRCVRFYCDHAGGRDFDVFASKNWVYFGRQEDGVLESEFSGNLVEVCPTGVFTDKTLMRHYTRKWDLETAPSICIHCGLGCSTIPGARYGELRRIRARFNGDVNGYFLCDRGRYGYEFVNSKVRVRQARVRDASGRPSEAVLDEALARARKILSAAKGVVGVGSPRTSLEDNYALRKLVGDANFSTGLSDFEQQAVDAALAVLRDGPARTPSLAEIENADVIVVLGADPTGEAPMLDFAIRQAMRKAPLDVARKLKIPDWDANAVANALQQATGKLYIAAPWPVKIEEIAADVYHTSLPGIAEFASRIQGSIQTGWAAEGETAARAAADVSDARLPLVVTSVSAGAEVIRAAANVAWALCDYGKDCLFSVVVPEANTMGVAMLGGMSASQALDRVRAGEADSLIVLQSDLSRRVEHGRLEEAMKGLSSLIVLDCIETAAAQAADVVVPAAAYVECDGTLTNNEGRAQRFYQVFVPPHDPPPAWRTLRDLAPQPPDWKTYEDVLRDLARENPELAPALEAAQPAGWRDSAGRKIARMSHRFSGRTAKDADKTILEPEPPDDPATPFAFSMEGDQNPPPGPLVPRFWWPGWNSNNSVNRFQIEVGGPLHGGNPGKRLIEPAPGRREHFPPAEAAELAEGEVWVVPRPRIFGSEELSALSQGIAELAGLAEVLLSPALADSLGVEDGDMLEFEAGGRTYRLPARLEESAPADVAAVPAGFRETRGIVGPVKCRLRSAK